MIEVCKKCKREFDDDVHFIRCNEDDCPMRGENVLDMLLGQDDETVSTDTKEK